MKHDEWCECQECYGRPMFGLALICGFMALAVAALFRWLR